MHHVFASCTTNDYAFLVELLDRPLAGPGESAARRALAGYEAAPTETNRDALDHALEAEIRYLGSSDLAYWGRHLAGRTPGVPFREIIRDVARALDVPLSGAATEREQLIELVERYATAQFAGLPPEQQQRMLESLGVEQERAAAFVLKSAGVFSLPLLLAAFDAVVVQGLIKGIVFGTITRLVGRAVAGRLFALLAARMPWWLGWVAPAAWTLSIGATVLDLQGPAMRKTIPATLYLGLCALRPEAA